MDLNIKGILRECHWRLPKRTIISYHVPRDKGWGFEEGQRLVKNSQESKIEFLWARGLVSAD